MFVNEIFYQNESFNRKSWFFLDYFVGGIFYEALAIFVVLCNNIDGIYNSTKSRAFSTKCLEKIRPIFVAVLYNKAIKIWWRDFHDGKSKDWRKNCNVAKK